MTWGISDQRVPDHPCGLQLPRYRRRFRRAVLDAQRKASVRTGGLLSRHNAFDRDHGVSASALRFRPSPDRRCYPAGAAARLRSGPLRLQRRNGFRHWPCWRMQRERVFSDAAKNGYWVGAAHISFPGLGHVGVRRGGFVWIPGEYTMRLSAPRSLDKPNR